MKFSKNELLFFVSQGMFAFALAFVPLYLEKQGLPLYSIIILYILYSLTSIITIPLMRITKVKRFLQIGLIVHVLLMPVLIYYVGFFSVILYGLLVGLTVGFYWIPMNYLFFDRTHEKRRALRAAHYGLIMKSLGIFLPYAAALIIFLYGFQTLFWLGALFMLVPLFFTRNLKETVYTQKFSEARARYKGLGILTMMSGAMSFFHVAIVPVYVLLFLKSELQVGGFFSYLALVGLIASLYVSKHSDRQGKRLRHLDPWMVLMGGTLILLGIVQKPIYWFILIGVYAVLDIISNPIRLAIFLDEKKHDVGFWRIREFYLHSGRIIVLSVCTLFFYVELYSLVFFLYALLVFSFPLVVRYKLPKVN